jgi:hypothetical protein
MPNSADAPAAPLLALPNQRSAQVLLFTIRRMAMFGLDDAHAAHAVFTHFGLRHRRPLVLIRALMAEIARAAQRTVLVAPCCCMRMTGDEARLIEAIETANSDGARSSGAFSELMGTRHTLGVLVTAQAVSQSFFDLGRPLSLYTV